MRRSRLSSYKQDKLIELFIAGSTARTASELVSVTYLTQKIVSFKKIFRIVLIEENVFSKKWTRIY